MGQIDRVLRSNLKLRHLQLLVALDEFRHLGKAAEFLSVTQPAVSKVLAEIEEAFRVRLAANPEPKGELEHINPYTLLVAVVLSAQATDAGVNKATKPLFAIVDTPQKMVALGEERLREAIKTIGLYRTKAKNVIALSKALIERCSGAAPRDR